MKKVIPFKILPWYLLIVFVAVLINKITWGDPKRAFFEGVGILLILLMIIIQKPVRIYLEHLPTLHKMIVTVFFLLLVAAELVDKSRTTFPFVSFKLYSIPMKSSEVIFYRYEGSNEFGHKVLLSPGKLFPTAARSFHLGIEELMKSVAATDEGNAQALNTKTGNESSHLPRDRSSLAGLKRFSRTIRSALQDQLNLKPELERQGLFDAFSAMGRRYNRKHSGDLISDLEVSRCSFDFHKTSLEEASCKVLWHVKIPEEGKI